MLVLRSASVSFKHARVLLGLNLRLAPGELCVLVGKNGVGKSSLANALVADDRYVVSGVVDFRGISVLSVNSLSIAKLGMFLAFQHPAEIPGVIFVQFVRLAVSRLNSRLLDVLPLKFSVLAAFLSLPTGLLYRPVNVGFSGGERRMLELLQMIALEPRLCILDETDSGLDRVRLKSYVELVFAFGSGGRSVLVITHNVGVIRALTPDSVYCLTRNGVINIRKALYGLY
ncbi:ATP-binding cassette domain-containing protein [Candidatus Hodgkinia cicadicola]